LIGRPTPTTRQVSGRGPPPQLPPSAGQPPIMCRSATEQSISRGRHSCPRGTSRMQMDGLRSHHTGVPDVKPPQHPEDCHSRRLHRRDLVDQCSAYACPMRAHAGVLRATTSTCWPPRTRSSAAARAAPPCHGMPCAALIRPREIHPRNSHLRRAPELETAGQAPAPLHEVRA